MAGASLQGLAAGQDPGGVRGHAGQVALPLNLAAQLRPVAAGHRDAMAATALHSAFLLAILLLNLRRRSLYQRCRKWLIEAMLVLMPLKSRLMAPAVFHSPGCPQRWLVYWLREVTLHLFPWLCLTALALRLPLRRSAWVQALTAAGAIAGAEQRRRLSMWLCPAGAERYHQLASGATMAAALLVPPPLSELVLGLQQQLTPALSFHLVDLFLHVMLSYAAVLLQLHRWELGQRQTFARQQGLAAEAAALQQKPRGWHGGTHRLCFVFAAWLLCLCCLLPLRPLTFLGRLDSPAVSADASVHV
ncbi:hypothetical protein ABPG75_005026 [Micractinium tetrahymenae]